jgi:hypothetical protein
LTVTTTEEETALDPLELETAPQYHMVEVGITVKTNWG